MNDEQRLAELPTCSRMAWSSRPVWDRRPSMGQRSDHRADMGVARRHRSHGGSRRHSRDRTNALARSESLVVVSSHTGKESV